MVIDAADVHLIVRSIKIVHQNLGVFEDSIPMEEFASNVCHWRVHASSNVPDQRTLVRSFS